MRVRIGIDVGGTFTDAVAINNDTYELIGQVKIPTTHKAKKGVAEGIVQSIKKLISENNININDIIFIAHGTTQATNALLEGDFSPVGIISVGNGKLSGLKTRIDSTFENLEISSGKKLDITTYYIDHNSNLEKNLQNILNQIKLNNLKTIVAAQAFSVDNSDVEKEILRMCIKSNLYATATHEISQLYGLKTRTKTAAINACILPKMIETADMTQSSIRDTGINAPLMIMRCDGGIMSINEVKKRPLLTILSGPAAGVAGALIYEKISTGIFLEVGGTSTDISVIKNGKVMLKYAQIGKHKLYLNSLDVHTIGVAGGSMVRILKGNILDVGPRSAHIAGLEYSCFSAPEDMVEPHLISVRPDVNDAYEYCAVQTANNKEFAITVTCAANALGIISNTDYSLGNKESAQKALAPLAKFLNMSISDTANKILDIASNKCISAINNILSPYEIDINELVLVGGGGACGALLPCLSSKMNIPFKICKNAPIISTIGVALAMIREVVERTVFNPSESEIQNIKNLAVSSVIKTGGIPSTVQTSIEFDKQKNILRAIATGSIELDPKHLTEQRLDKDDILKIASTSMNLSKNDISVMNTIGRYFILKGTYIKEKFYGLLKKQYSLYRVIDSNGIIRINKKAKDIIPTSTDILLETLQETLSRNTVYNDAGINVPQCFLIFSHKIVDLTSFRNTEQILSVAKSELSSNTQNEKLLIFVI